MMMKVMIDITINTGTDCAKRMAKKRSIRHLKGNRSGGRGGKSAHTSTQRADPFGEQMRPPKGEVT